MRLSSWIAPLLLVSSVSLMHAADAPLSAAHEEFFESKIRPILVEHCFKCHGGKSVKKGLKLNSLASLMKGGDSGPALDKDDPHRSLILQAMMRTEDGTDAMPPKDPLPKHIVDDFKKWVDMGAPWPNMDRDLNAKSTLKPSPWSFTPPVRHDPPTVKMTGWGRTPIDAFVLKRQEEAGLGPQKKADRRSLIRRATLDLWGLPPTPDAVRDFVKDESPDAWPVLIDRLLNDPAYGQRWGRYWLDVARYADTSGDGTDMPIPEAAFYRDYVIQAFNDDFPYDEFLREQIAGDRLFLDDPKTRPRERLIATTFVGLSRRYGVGVVKQRPLVIDNTLETISKSMLGLGLQCARCHDHKFDPISIDDYYSFYGYFDNTRYPHPGSEKGKTKFNMLPLVDSAEDFRTYRKFAAEQLSLSEQLDDLGKKGKRPIQLIKKMKTLEKELKVLNKQTPINTAALQKKKQAIVKTRTLLKDATALRDHYDTVKKTLQKTPHAYGVADTLSDTKDSPLFIGGDSKKWGPRIQRAFIGELDSSKPIIPEGQSGRLQLANWIASADNPLTARVMVNRIWQHHFGTGIVRTPNVFGNQGTPPSHPQLLDWLATEFVAQKWSIKSMHRIIMRSSTYQLSNHASEQKLNVDPDNRLLWRYSTQRLDAEAIRDSILAVSGRLNYADPVPHPFPKDAPSSYTQHHPFTDNYDHQGRSVYLLTRRLGTHPFLALFDPPDTNNSTGRRGSSTVPQQALFAMNSEFMSKSAHAFAGRVTRSTEDRASRIAFAYQLAFQRDASPDEEAQVGLYLDRYQEQLTPGTSNPQGLRQAWTSVSRAILGSSEFIYLN